MKNKTIKLLIFVLLALPITISCESELNSFNVSPNSPTSVTPDLLLSQTEVATFAIHTTGLARLSNMFTQHIAGTSEGQYGGYANYNIAENAVSNEWDAIYSDALINASLIQKDYGAENPYYSGIAKILTAINLSYATDFWGDVPYSDALEGLEGNSQPKYDKQEDIYNSLQSILSDAVSLLKKPTSSNINLPGADDFIFGGDIAKWIKTAYVLKARFAMRLENKDNAAKYIKMSNMGEGDDMQAIFTSDGNSKNQWAAFNNERGNYLKMGKFFIDLMSSINDPRLPFMATKDDDGNYTGNAPEDITTTTSSNIGTFLSTDDKNVGIVTYVEAKFIEAEALLASNPTKAKEAFKEAVSISVKQVTGTENINFVNSVISSVTKENIIKQKYIALFGSMEPYNDFRRTGFPKLKPNSNSSIKMIPLRLPTPQAQRLYNPNATIVSNLTTPVWWDKN